MRLRAKSESTRPRVLTRVTRLLGRCWIMLTRLVPVMRRIWRGRSRLLWLRASCILKSLLIGCVGIRLMLRSRFLVMLLRRSRLRATRGVGTRIEGRLWVRSVRRCGYAKLRLVSRFRLNRLMRIRLRLLPTRLPCFSSGLRFGRSVP